MSRPRVAWLAVALTAACAAEAGTAGGGASPVSQAGRLEAIARAEGRRELLDGELRKWALFDNDLTVRRTAIRALGRVGGAEAIQSLRGLVTAEDPDVSLAAVDALWLAGAVDAVPDLVTQYHLTSSGPIRVAILRALGHLGKASQMPLLVEALVTRQGDLCAAATRAAGVYGRRRIPWSRELAQALLALDVVDPEVRAGRAYALAQEVDPAPSPSVADLLLRIADDDVPEARAMAIKAMAARQMAGHARVVRALDDADPWVRVEAVRALAGERATPASRARLAAWLGATRPGDGPMAHAVLAAAERLVPHGAEPGVAAALRKAADAAPRGPIAATLSCHAALAALAPARASRGVPGCDDPAGKRMLLARAKDATWGLPAERAGVVSALARDADPLVMASAAEAAATLGDAALDRVVRAALEHPATVVAGSAADALVGRAEAGADVSRFAAAVLVRADRERAGDPELFMSLLSVLAASRTAEARPLFQWAAASHPIVAVQAKGRAGMEALGAATPDTPQNAVPAAPVDLASVLGRALTLEVVTTRGTFHVKLDADVAPWNVANLVALARKGFYDGTVFHRVVPGFVVQGGDPTGSGWGGPGYSVIAEVSSALYEAGTVGIADAGRDTGGSQWFVTHVPTPHLEGRYTIVGTVPPAERAIVNRLVVGDRIVKVTVRGAE